ncbi:MAG: mannose-1-phosphate guanylyltransferase [Proteobacteria bacterium]|nr:mannose-1-phosphate guanylyltransferase [Pseudomonadota bacterium]
MSRRLPLHALVLAGGAGERFWPASRRRRPKPLLEVVGGESLLEATVSRASRFAAPERTWIVCGREHAREIRRVSGLPGSRVLIEPRRRNTAMAVAWAALRIRAEDPDALIAVLPADHYVPDARAFADAIRRAARAARDAGVLVTLGVRPTRPDTSYGYIQEGPPAGRGHPGLRRVRRFVEKPDPSRARRFLRQGGYRWNAGVFVWSAQTLLEEIEVCAPKLHRALAPLRRAPRARRADVLERAYRLAPSLPIDVAVMERSQRVWTLPVEFSWTDVGTWASLAEELGVGRAGRAGKKDRTRGAGNRVIAGDVLIRDARNNLVWGEKRLVALLGVDGLAVVDTGDVILITKLDRSPDVRRLVSELESTGRVDLI